MPIQLRCDCGVELVVPEELRGKQVRCPECNTVVTVEAVAVELAAVKQRDDEDAMSTSVDKIKQEDTPAAAAVRDPCWLCRTPEGEEFGPVDRRELDDWVREGRISHDCELAEVSEVHTDDLAWSPAHIEYPMLLERGNPFAQQRPAVLPSERELHRGGTILVLALIGCFVPFFSLLPAVLGIGDLRRIQSGKIDPSGESLTRAGQIIAMVATMFWLAAFAVGLLVLLTIQ